jgi:hypothetical protein
MAHALIYLRQFDGLDRSRRQADLTDLARNRGHQVRETLLDDRHGARYAELLWLVTAAANDGNTLVIYTPRPRHLPGDQFRAIRLHAEIHTYHPFRLWARVCAPLAVTG